MTESAMADGENNQKTHQLDEWLPKGVGGSWDQKRWGLQVANWYACCNYGASNAAAGLWNNSADYIYYAQLPVLICRPGSTPDLHTSPCNFNQWLN